MLEKLCLLSVLLLQSQSLPNPQTELDEKLAAIFVVTENTITTTTALTTQPWDIAIDCIPNYLLNTNTESITSDNTADSCGIGYDCVPYYLCKGTKVIDDGSGIIDIRGRRKRSVDENTTASKICSYLESCCKIEIQKPPTQVRKECGIRNVDGIEYRIRKKNDNVSLYGEFPWMIAILNKEKDVNEKIINVYKCGGSLITSSVVLTAAHCVTKKPVNSFKVRAGEWDAQSTQELYMHQDRDLIDIVVHENFDEKNLFNDIALLFVSIPFDFDENIQPVCLPPHRTNFDYLRCFTTGWGSDFGKANLQQVILKNIDLPIIPNSQCEAEFRKTRLGRYFKLNESFMCAGGETGKGTCQVDGGSPLVCPITNAGNRYYQAGIVAWKIGCGIKVPDAFVSVSFLRPWIDGVLAKKNIPYTQFTYKY